MYLLAFTSHIAEKLSPIVILIISLSVVLVVFPALNRALRSLSAGNFTGKAMEPPMVASWLPWIGSGIQYILHPLTFFIVHSIPNSSFKCRIFGQTFVAISSPTAISNIFRDFSGSFDTINARNIHLLTGMKVSKDRVPYIYSVLQQQAVPPVHRALMPSRLPIISSRLTEELMKALKQIDLANCQISLNDFVHRTLYRAASIALLGANFPLDTYQNFMIFDEGAALQVRNLGTFAGAANTAREALFASWTRYLVENWVSEKQGYLVGAADMMSDVYRGLKQSDLSHDEVHRLMFSIIWAIHANVMELITWVMCYIITDKAIYSRVCQEIRSFVDQQYPQIDGITQIDPKDLDDDAFQFLNSVVQEVMRTKTAIGPMRVANRDAIIMDEDDKEILIHKGEVIFINLPGMHHSSSLHKEPELFKADRFINGAAYRSYIFGGGKHICAGRNYAKFAVRQFIIMTLAMYDIQQCNGVNGSGLPDSDGTMGLKLMLFSRRQNDLSIMLHPVSTSSIAK